MLEVRNDKRSPLKRAGATQNELPVKEIFRDIDYLYRWFDDIVAARGPTVRRLAFRTPNLHAFVERCFQSLLVECLDYV